MDQWIWMKHDGHGGVARFPAAAREGWQGRGWVECPAPDEEVPAPLESGQKKEKVKGNG